ncbi:squalene--hopene cyclase [Paenibacillus sp. PDC88]|uniref:squalene--hopene cyclase n=1 Tax=Paenibacillus sp. PDC88 TaxID=1884375 RepID=UPI0008972F7F|nr:squalene--hopene cyclase [Paenibacillus sp. PDC88]SDX89452.1 sporulenol synthase [Paenibacillus sp. PDC88]
MKVEVETEINRKVEWLKKEQSPDGAWRFYVESGPLSDAYMIILLRSLQIDDEERIRLLAERIARLQEKNGAWKLFHDEAEGHLSATIEAYYALLYAGYKRKDDELMQRAKQFILSKGGLSEASLYTKVLLALTGQYPWPSPMPVPVEALLLPQQFPFHFFDFVGYARVHFAPILVCADRKLVIKTARTPDLSDLYADSSEGNRISDQAELRANEFYRSLLSMIVQGIKHLPFSPWQIHSAALHRAEQFILQRTEPDGTLYSYFTSTFLMIFAWIALGHAKSHPVITRAIRGLENLTCRTNAGIHVQNFTSTVWDTALLSHALQEAGVSPSSPTIQKAGLYLLSRQHQKYGDWRIRNPRVPPGGWGFSDINTINPDIDDTTAALRAIRRFAQNDREHNHAYLASWNRGMNWLLSMQNDNGGWPAFEKNTDKSILDWVPIKGLEEVSTDLSTADLTGRTLEFLGNDAGFTFSHRAVDKGIRWLLRNQEEDGSWDGRWGVSYIYGTWAAITGLTATGVPSRLPAIERAVKWLLSIQNADGGWGESCRSDIEQKYVPLGASTPSQSAWALDALLAVYKRPTAAIDRGMRFLMETSQRDDWTTRYPTGAGLPGGFYFHYHSYRHIWPLLALSRYKKTSINVPQR